MTSAADAASPWEDAELAAALLAVDPAGLGGAALRSQSGPARDAWLDTLRGFMPASAPFRRVPLRVADERLLGGLDLAATLSAGRPMFQRGLLAECDGGIALLAMAERFSPAAAARIARVLDDAEVVSNGEGCARRFPARIAVVALDEGVDDEHVPMCLADRLALHVDLRAVDASRARATLSNLAKADIGSARAGLAAVMVEAEVVDALCTAALAFGVLSLRAPLLAVRVARANAALRGTAKADQSDAIAAARLVLAPRASTIPQLPATDDQPPAGNPEEPREAPREANEAQAEPSALGPLTQVVVEATRAALPPALLATLTSGSLRQQRKSQGRAGALQRSSKGGRAVGSQQGDPRRGARLDIVETLKAAAPWQRIRRREAGVILYDRPMHIRRDDLRIVRFKQRSETTTIFVVDASGSTAAQRLGEAKGAVELLLAECYVRRDQVALLAFGGNGAEILLPPTRSLSRSKRCLADLPGGGGTPLAAALLAATGLAEAVRRKGQTPLVVLLTDGSANLTREGKGDRVRAHAEALEASRLLGSAQLATLLIDTSPQPRAPARDLAKAMQARYVPLPQADARTLAGAVRNAHA
jgi:magnesium chelatase subunit D